MTQPIEVLPRDEFNQTLVANVHPPDWQNPVPSGRYNLVVIGGGTAGLISAVGAAGLGAKVALIEKHLIGGDCLNVGCVPSKALISASRVAATVRAASGYGVNLPGEVSVDFTAVMERMRRLRAQISHHDAAARFRGMGIDIYLDEGVFEDANTVRVGEQRLRFKKAVIATGARAAAPDIPGLQQAGYLTNETIFSLTELPRRLAVIGGGPIGCELSQAFARFGSRVMLLETHSQVLGREDAEAAQIVARALQRDGVELLTDSRIEQVEVRGTERVIRYQRNGTKTELVCDAILLAAGRQPNVEGLNLEATGVNFDSKKGVEVNDRLQTSQPNIFACGDICSKYKFTHAADFQARLVIRNALLPFGRAKASNLIIPWCTYTAPELAHVGLSEADARSQGIPIDTYTQELSEVDRAIVDGETEGFIKVHVKQGSDKILGATIVAAHAGDLISQISQAMTNDIGLKSIANVISPYPTQAEAIRKLGDQYNRTRLTPRIKSLFETWFRWTR